MHPPPRCNRSALPPLLLVAASASGAFDLLVTLRHVALEAYRYRIGIGIG